MKTLTRKEAIKQGYTNCGKVAQEWQQLHRIDELDEIDFDGEVWMLAQKYGKPFTFDKEFIADTLADDVYQNEKDYSGRDDDEVYDAIKALDFSQTEKLINDALANFPVYFLTDIRLIP